MAPSLMRNWSPLAAALLLIGASHSAAADEKIAVGVISFYAPMAPVYAAEELGIYKKNGVAADLIGFKGGTPAQEALIVGAVDIIPGSPMLAAIALKKGVREMVVGPVTDSPAGWHIIVPADSPAKTVSDLRGKSVGVSAVGGLSDYYIVFAALQAGIPVNRVPVGSGGLIPSLKGKQIDAGVMPPPVSFEMLLSGQGRSIYDLGTEIGSTSMETWVVPPAFIEQHGKAIGGFLRSVYQALDYMKKNREYSVAFLKKFTGVSDDKVVAAEFDQMLAKMPDSARIEQKTLDDSIKFALSVGAITAAPALDQIYSAKFATVSAKE